MKSATSGLAVLHVDTTDPVTQLTGLPRRLDEPDRAADCQRHATPALGWNPADADRRPSRRSRWTAARRRSASGRIRRRQRDRRGGTPGRLLRPRRGRQRQRRRLDQRHRRPDAADRLGAGSTARRPASPSPTLRTHTIPTWCECEIADAALRTRHLTGLDRRAAGRLRRPLRAASPSHAGERRAARPLELRRIPGRRLRVPGGRATTRPAMRTATTRRRNGEPMILSNPLKATTTLRAGFRRARLAANRSLRSPRSAQRPTRHRQELAAGRRAGPGGRALRRRRPSRRHGCRRSRTGPDGAFSIRTAPGPSRTIAIGLRRQPDPGPLGRPARSSSACASRVRLRASAGVAKVGGAPLVFRGRLVRCTGRDSAGGQSRSNCSSACRACPGRSSARSRPTAVAASATPTASATTTAAAPASSSAPTRPRRTTGRTSPQAHGQSSCKGAEGARRGGPDLSELGA